MPRVSPARTTTVWTTSRTSGRGVRTFGFLVCLPRVRAQTRIAHHGQCFPDISQERIVSRCRCIVRVLPRSPRPKPETGDILRVERPGWAQDRRA